MTLLPHREGVRLVTPDAPQRDEGRDPIEPGVTVTVGATCFDARNLPRESVPGVEIVPGGVSELVRLQAEGYSDVEPP